MADRYDISNLLRLEKRFMSFAVMATWLSILRFSTGFQHIGMFQKMLWKVRTAPHRIALHRTLAWIDEEMDGLGWQAAFNILPFLVFLALIFFSFVAAFHFCFAATVRF